MAVFRVNKTRDYTVMSNHHLRNTQLSLKAKGLLSLMLSLPEDWDYTTKGLAKICKDGVDSICTGINELEKAGYVTRERQRDEGGRLGDIEYTIYEQPQAASPKRENPVLDNPVQVKPILDKPELGNPAQLNIDISNTDSSNTFQLCIDQSIHPTHAICKSKNRTMDTIYNQRNLIRVNIDYEHLLMRYGKKRIDELVQLMLDVLCSKCKSIRIGGTDISAEVVKSRILMLECQHIEYVLECLDRNATKIQNIRAYMLTSFFNAPSTIEHYYRATVNHDLNGGF